MISYSYTHPRALACRSHVHVLASAWRRPSTILEHRFPRKGRTVSTYVVNMRIGIVCRLSACAPLGWGTRRCRRRERAFGMSRRSATHGCGPLKCPALRFTSLDRVAQRRPGDPSTGGDSGAHRCVPGAHKMKRARHQATQAIDAVRVHRGRSHLLRGGLARLLRARALSRARAFNTHRAPRSVGLGCSQPLPKAGTAAACWQLDIVCPLCGCREQNHRRAGVECGPSAHLPGTERVRARGPSVDGRGLPPPTSTAKQ